MEERKLASKKFVTLSVLGLIMIIVPLVLRSDRIINTTVLALLAIILAASNRLPLVGGAWHFGHIAFYAIGAYSLYLSTTRLGLSFWVALPLSGIVATLIALLFSVATYRVKSTYFALLTMAFLEVVRLTITFTPALGGFRALSTPAPNTIAIPKLLTVTFDTRLPYYYLVLCVTLLTLLVLYRVEKSRIGSMLKAYSQSEDLAESIGINTTKFRVLSFCIASFFAGIGGAIYASYVKVIGPSAFTLSQSIIIWFYMVLGGVGSFWGPVIGALFLVFLRDYLPGSGAVEDVVFGSIIMVVFIVLPGGLASIPAIVRKGLTRFRTRIRTGRTV